MTGKWQVRKLFYGQAHRQSQWYVIRPDGRVTPCGSWANAITVLRYYMQKPNR